MNTAASSDPRIQEVRVTEDEIIAHLADGRVISVPLAWSWRLCEATPAQRANFRLIGTGQGVHWPDVDEDLSVEGMLHGVPARRPKTRAAVAAPRKVRHGEVNDRGHGEQPAAADRLRRPLTASVRRRDIYEERYLLAGLDHRRSTNKPANHPRRHGRARLGVASRFRCLE